MVSRPHNECENALAGDPVRVLLIDDEADTLLPPLAQKLEDMGFEFHKESNAARALRSVDSCNPDVILLDLHFPGDDRHVGRTTGGKLLTAIRQQFDSIPVVVFTSRLDDVDIPLETFDEQPHGYLAKPDFGSGRAWVDALATAMRDAIDTARFARDPDACDLGFLVGQTREMHEVAGRIRTAAGHALTVLIFGETGTGKQRAAEAIHKLSGRKGRFEHFNCADVHEETLDVKLFGQERGAFTGAHAAKPGLFELADGGTLFLDEVQRMPMSLQDKLMLVVESGNIRRMGATDDRKTDVRLIVATNHNLSDLVADGVLREDLAHRFSQGVLIFLPPLRQRLVDLPELFKIFVDKASRDLGKGVLDTLRPEVKGKLEAHFWNGNIRELESTIIRAVVNANSNVLLPQHIEFVSLTRRGLEAPASAVPESADIPPATPAVADTPPSALEEALTDQLESLPVNLRYSFLLDQGTEMQKLILIQFVCRLRRKTNKKVQHKALAASLDTLSNGETDFARIRQFVCSRVNLSKLDFNQ
jgi:DNA-binding NtrC family response regulator